jgi:hypothetical protein
VTSGPGSAGPSDPGNGDPDRGRLPVALAGGILAGTLVFVAIGLLIGGEFWVGGFTLGYMIIASVGVGIGVLLAILGRGRHVLLGLVTGILAWAVMALLLGRDWLGMFTEGVMLLASVSLGVGVMMGLRGGGVPRAAAQGTEGPFLTWVGGEAPRLIRPVGLGLLAGILVGFGIALLIDSIPTENEQRFWVGAILFWFTILLSIVVGAVALPSAILRRSYRSLGVFACAVCLPVTMWIVTDYLWQRALAM